MNRCSLKNGGQRPKAWIGTAIALASTAASIINNYRQNKLLKEQNDQQIKDNNLQVERENLINQSDSINNLLLSKRRFKEQEPELFFNAGGRVSLKQPSFKITKGGYATPLDSHTFLLRGRSHENGGIDMTFGKGKNKVNIEAEGGEIVENTSPRSAFVYSDRINLGNGITPKDAILLGYNRNNIKSIQQVLNGNHISSPVRRNIHKAALGDAINLGADLLSSYLIGQNNINTARQLNTKLAKPKRISEIPVYYNTTYDNSAELNNVDKNLQDTIKYIGQNTASSSRAIQLANRAGLQAMLDRNNLMQYKANKEIDLRNHAADVEAQRRARQADRDVRWSEQYANTVNQERALENNRISLIGDARSNMIAGFNRAGTNFYNAIQQRKADNNALQALMASSNPGSMQTFLNNGGTFGTETDAQIYNTLKNKNDNGEALTPDEINILNVIRSRMTPLQRRWYFNEDKAKSKIG